MIGGWGRPPPVPLPPLWLFLKRWSLHIAATNPKTINKKAILQPKKYTKLIKHSFWDNYKGHHNGCCLAYIWNTSNLDSNHYGGHCIISSLEKRLSALTYNSVHRRMKICHVFPPPLISWAVWWDNTCLIIPNKIWNKVYKQENQVIYFICRYLLLMLNSMTLSQHGYMNLQSGETWGSQQ